MQKQDRYCLAALRERLLDHPVYAEVASVEDLRRFMEDHVFAVWDFMSLLKRLQKDLTCTNVPWFPADNARAARLINDIVIGEETDVDPDGSYVSHLDLYLRAMADVGASTLQFDRFRSLVLVGVPVDVALTRIGAPTHVQAFVAHTMALANSGSTEEVLAAFFYGREDIIPEMFRRLLNTLYGAKHNNDRLRHELLRNVGDGRGQAASGCWLTASMPSMNFMPVISFGKWLWPSRRRQLFSAACASLKTMAIAVLFERHPLERTVRCRTVANVLSMGLVVRRCFQCSAGKS